MTCAPHPGSLPIRCGEGEEPAQWVGLHFAGLVGLGNDGWGGFDAPAYGAEDELELGGRGFDFEIFQRLVHAVAEEVVVGKEVAAEFLAQQVRSFDETGVAFPGGRVEEPALGAFGQGFLGGIIGRVGRIGLFGQGPLQTSHNI